MRREYGDGDDMEDTLMGGSVEDARVVSSMGRKRRASEEFTVGRSPEWTEETLVDVRG